jgi:poly(beta-D-mannuronate) lyase
MKAEHKRSKLFISLLLALAGPAALACSTPPAAMIDIDANSYYTDSHHSVIDPVLRARNIANTKPIEDFLAEVANGASLYQADPKAKQEDGACALAWLASWAEQRALLGKLSSEQAFYVRKWTLGGMALSYAKLKPLAAGAQRQAIETWLKALAEATMAHSEAHKGVRNNHYYWEGLAVTAAGAVTGEQRYLDWGRKVFDQAMAQVAADGSLPREMERAAKALHYHVFSIVPLTMMASILDLHSARLDQLAQFVIAAAADPSGIEKATGVKQEPASKGDMAQWRLVYGRHEGKPELIMGVPARQARLGGDMNQLNPLEHPAPAK